jgi:biotin carboxylase
VLELEGANSARHESRPESRQTHDANAAGRNRGCASLLVAWGESRDDARRRAADALRAFQVDGIRTNREFLIARREHPEFVAGDVYTGFIVAHRAALMGSAG